MGFRFPTGVREIFFRTASIASIGPTTATYEVSAGGAFRRSKWPERVAYYVPSPSTEVKISGVIRPPSKICL
jgi:hypothetical protein